MTRFKCWLKRAKGLYAALFALSISVAPPAVYAADPAVDINSVAVLASQQTVPEQEIVTTVVVGTKHARPKIGIALGGGGTRGAAHIGVLRVLENEGIPIDVVTGTSIGSAVGGLYCAGVSVDRIENEFRNKALMRSYMTVPIVARMLIVPFFLVPHALGWKPYDGFYFGNKYRNYFESCLPQNKRNFKDLDIKFGAMTVNLTDLKAFPIFEGNVSQAVQASSAIPILRRPVPYGESALLVDGAIKNNLPVDAARTLGADFVIAVPVSERVEPVNRDSFRRIGSVARRIEQMFLSSADEPQMEQADVVIHPLVDGIKILSADKSDALKAIAAGEEAARASLPEIRKKLAVMGVAVASKKIVAPKDVIEE